MKVLFTTNIPSPYRVDFFNELGKYCDLTVTFTDKFYAERDKSWKDFKFDNFKGIFLKGYSIKNLRICSEIKKIIKVGNFDKIIISDFNFPTGMIAINYMRRKKIAYYLESDGGFAKSGKGFKEKIKRHFIKGSNGYFSTAKEHDKYYLTYGATEDKLIRYPFTSLKEENIEKSIITSKDKLALRDKLAIKEDKVVLTVGQFIHRKGFDVLLKASKNFNSGVGFYFIGGEPTEEYLQYKADNVHFIGFKKKADLKEYYLMADVFVLPTREDIWGLVINEAMANGLPIITTDKCIAGLELVKNGENGYIVPVDNVEELTKAINSVLENGENRKMGELSLKIIKDYTIEKMVRTHVDIMEKP